MKLSFNFTEDDKLKTEKFIDIKNRGYYASGEQVTEVYNRVFNKNVNSTTCSSCIRQRITELEVALKAFDAAQNKASGDDKTPLVDNDTTHTKITQQNAKKRINAKPKQKALSAKKE